MYRLLYKLLPKPYKFNFIHLGYISIQYKDRILKITNKEDYRSLPKLYWKLKEFDNNFFFEGILKRIPRYLSPLTLDIVLKSDNSEMENLINAELDILESKLNNVCDNEPKGWELNLCSYCVLPNSFIFKRCIDEITDNNKDVTIIVKIIEYKGSYKYDLEFKDKIVVMGRR